MATDCDTCGYKSNEVKAGGPISVQGKKITLRVLDREDLSRDVLKVLYKDVNTLNFHYRLDSSNFSVSLIG
jgi:C4-type Zn-finger protein